MKLGEVIILNKESLLDISDFKEYNILGVQSYGRGVVLRRREFGKNMKMKKYKVARENQLMWCKVDTKNGAFGVTKKEHGGCLASTNMALADINTEKYLPEFLELLFRNRFFYEDINNKSTGTTNRKYLKPWEVLERIEIPNLSLKEQKNFLKKYEFIENCGLSKNISHDKTLLSSLRQSILQEAVQGKLVPQDPKDEPASELLKKIKVEKEKLIKEKKIKKQKHLPEISEDEIPYELPKAWVWCRLGDVFSTTSGGTPNRGILSYWKGQIPWLKSGELDDNLNINSSEEFISEEGLKNSSAKIFEKGTLVMALYGATAGKLGILGFDTTTNQAVCNFQKNTFVENMFLFYFLKSQREKIISECFGAPATRRAKKNC